MDDAFKQRTRLVILSVGGNPLKLKSFFENIMFEINLTVLLRLHWVSFCNVATGT